VRQHVAEVITGKRVAAVVHASPADFVRLFREATGRTFAQYVADLRVERAKTLLADPSMSLQQIACAAGFTSIAQFKAAFRKRVGKSPADYQAHLHED
jgi:transcriptional regulator GlxA family with amidase domain